MGHDFTRRPQDVSIIPGVAHQATSPAEIVRFANGSTMAVLSRLQRQMGYVGANHLCPCGSGRKFKKCCRLLGSHRPPTPLETMARKLEGYRAAEDPSSSTPGAP